MNAPLQLTAPAMQAVLLTVPPFPVRRDKIGAWVSLRRAMSESTFRKCLHRLCGMRQIKRNKCGEYQLT